MTTPARPAAARGRAAAACAIGCALAFVVLATAVAAGATQGVDDRVRQVFRPDDVWGVTQLRVDVLVEGLQPRNALLVAAVVTVAAAWAQRSWRPVGLAALVVGPAGVVVLGVKELIEHPDPHGLTPGFGGSFPSGHVAALLVCSGLVVLLLGLGSRWTAWLVVALLGAAMALALLLQAAHWASDVLGGALVGAAGLATTTAVLARRHDAARAGQRAAAPNTSLDSRFS
ncbi:membrane-associated phospholipid phosphatase [Mumia flava]|uniref:Membrane-associated phospholipid phosphatase n=1 Tax=Mumia flava TaxID=1348852 RepID=A0A0B2B6S0_9ACTN|nr:phosphatase PAP2 family protein [Mumia flava]PJJ56859.1 membrane-associated phospholipid phosphatase [Mumia flava]